MNIDPQKTYDSMIAIKAAALLSPDTEIGEKLTYAGGLLYDILLEIALCGESVINGDRETTIKVLIHKESRKNGNRKK